jgi:hypothetical protein
VKDLSAGTPIFSLAAQMRMRYQVVDHGGVKERHSVVFKL